MSGLRKGPDDVKKGPAAMFFEKFIFPDISFALCQASTAAEFWPHTAKPPVVLVFTACYER